jgi:Tol biopolymer transport system component
LSTLGLCLGPGASAGITERASVSSAGLQGDGISGRTSQPALDASGSIVAFDSEARNLVPNDANGSVVDVFVRDRASGTTVLASVDSAGIQGNSSSTAPSLSGDGRFVAFASNATNLVALDTNSAMDVFIHDLATGATERVSVNSGGSQASGPSFFASVSGDGRFVAFASDAADLVPDDTNGTRDVFVRDRLLGTTERVSLASDGTQSNSDCAQPAITPDGRFVAFPSFARNLDPNDGNDSFDVFLHDRNLRVTERVSVDSFGNEANGPSAGAAVSADGRFVAFYSNASNLVPDDTNSTRDMFVRDRETGITERVNVSSAGVEADSQSGFSIRGGSTTPRISEDGRFVSFDSSARNLVPGDTNGSQDVFVRDRLSGMTERVSVGSGDEQGTDGSTDTAISADGLVTAFVSKAWNLVPGDTNRCGSFQMQGQCPDVFTHTRVPCAEGSVNAGVGPVTDVLRVNGMADFVAVRVGSPVEIRLDAAPAGPDPARYALWVWFQSPESPREFSAHGERLGCTVNPTPLDRGLAPQPFRCLRSQGMPTAVCRRVREIFSAPATAPWSRARAGGVARPRVFTLQGLLEDDGASARVVRFSVTNAVVVDVR